MKVRPITQYYWLRIPHDIRRELVSIFNIQRTGTAVMQDSKQLADGHSDRDLEVLTVGKLQEFTGSQEGDAYDLLDLAVEKIKNQQHESLEVHAKRMEEENIARWLKLIKDIEYQAKQLGLDGQFREVLFAVYDKPLTRKKKN